MIEESSSVDFETGTPLAGLPIFQSHKEVQWVSWKLSSGPMKFSNFFVWR